MPFIGAQALSAFADAPDGTFGVGVIACSGAATADAAVTCGALVIVGAEGTGASFAEE